MSGPHRNVDWALVNTETFDVLRTSSNQLVLEAIRDQLIATAQRRGHNADCYRVMEMRRAEMGDSLYERAIDTRWRQLHWHADYTGVRVGTLRF